MKQIERDSLVEVNFNVTPIYKDREKIIFEFLHINPEFVKITREGSKIKLGADLLSDLSKLV